MENAWFFLSPDEVEAVAEDSPKLNLKHRLQSNSLDCSTTQIIDRLR